MAPPSWGLKAFAFSTVSVFVLLLVFFMHHHGNIYATLAYTLITMVEFSYLLYIRVDTVVIVSGSASVVFAHLCC